MIPSRHTNPFSTCWTRPGAMAFRFPDGLSAERLVQQLADQGWWGEIVGPHGSGKSTLLATLVPLLRATGKDACVFALHDLQRSLPRGSLRKALIATHALIVVDGYEQLSWPQRAWLKLRCRLTGTGLLVTTHHPSGLPLLVRLAPELPLVQQLVAALTELTASPISGPDVAASHACHGSNVREILFDLYDRHERLMRSARTEAARVA